MLTPALSKLYAAAVASITPARAKRDAEYKADADAADTKLREALTRSINALEKGDVPAVEQAMRLGDFDRYHLPAEYEAYSQAVFYLCYPDAASPITENDPRMVPPAIAGDLPPSEPPSEAPVTAAAEPKLVITPEAPIVVTAENFEALCVEGDKLMHEPALTPLNRARLDALTTAIVAYEDSLPKPEPTAPKGKSRSKSTR